MYSLSRYAMPGAFKRFVQCLSVAAGLLFAQSSYAAVVIEYEAKPLASSPLGENLWQYLYHVSGYSAGKDGGFDIFFPTSLGFQFGDLQNPVAPNGDWDVSNLIQPDPNLPHGGFFEAAALVDNPSVQGSFNVTFNWLNGGTPGPQLFQVFDPNLAVLESNNTVPYIPAVPEPETVWQILWTIPLLVGFIRRKRAA